MNNKKTRLWYYGGKTWLNKQKLWHERVSEDFAMTDGNLETMYCGEVISDDVQMLNRNRWLEWN